MRRFDVTIAGELNVELIFYGLPEVLPLKRELVASGMIGGSSAIVVHNLPSLRYQVGGCDRRHLTKSKAAEVWVEQDVASKVEILDPKRRCASGESKSGKTKDGSGE